MIRCSGLGEYANSYGKLQKALDAHPPVTENDP